EPDEGDQGGSAEKADDIGNRQGVNSSLRPLQNMTAERCRVERDLSCERPAVERPAACQGGRLVVHFTTGRHFFFSTRLGTLPRQTYVGSDGSFPPAPVANRSAGPAESSGSRHSPIRLRN